MIGSEAFGRTLVQILSECQAAEQHFPRHRQRQHWEMNAPGWFSRGVSFPDTGPELLREYGGEVDGFVLDETNYFSARSDLPAGRPRGSLW